MILTEDAYAIGQALVADAKTIKNEKLKIKLMTLGCMHLLKCALRIKEDSLEKKAEALVEVALICIELNNFDLAKTLAAESFRYHPAYEIKKKIVKINEECRDAGY